MSEAHTELGNCPHCESAVKVDKADFESSGGDFTIDCDCGKTLRYTEQKLIDLHQSIHDDYKQWPADGKGTGFI